MKLNIKIAKKWPERVGGALVQMGVAFFCLMFWFPSGLTLGGDPVALGKFNPYLEVVFPLSGFAIFAVFIGVVLKGTEVALSRAQILSLFIFLAGTALLALFSLKPEISILFFILWMVGILSASFGKAFFLDTPQRQNWLLLGILLGFIAGKLFPSLDVSFSLLGVAALVLAFFIRFSDLKNQRLFELLFCFWVIFESQNINLILITFFCWILVGIFLPKTRQKNNLFFILTPIIFLIGLMIWGILNNFFMIAAPSLPFILDDWKYLLIGVGEGQFFTALSHFSELFYIPKDLILPELGASLLWIEKGILGFLLLGSLFFVRKLFSDRGRILWIVLWGLLALLITDILSLENGVLFFLVFLFAQKSKKNATS